MKKLTGEEIIVLGTAIAFELSANLKPAEIHQICELLGQVLYTLSNLAKN